MRLGNYLKLSTVLLLAIFLTSCATKMSGVANPGAAMDLNQKIKSGAAVQKADNFLILLDASSSMYENDKLFVGPDKFTTARDVAELLNQTIPDMKLEGGLRTFGPTVIKDSLIYGMTGYTKSGLGEAIDSVKTGGVTPMSFALRSAIGDLEQTSGNRAVIVISDGENNVGDAVAAAQSLKEQYGDGICIYTILVGTDEIGKQIMIDVAQAGGCGFATEAATVSSAAGMADFVEKVFLAMAPKKVQKAPAPAPPPPPAPAPMQEKKMVVIAFEDIYFDFDKSTLTKEAQVLLKKNIRILHENPGTKIRIIGYASASGSVAYNQKLSERRANSVKAYLAEEGGMTPDRFITIGYGETQPLAYETAPTDINSKAAKANMRVRFEIIK